MGEQPHYLTAFDMLFEAVHITLIAAGCYAGWLIGHGFIPLLVGGAVARVVWLVVWTALRPKLDDGNSK